MNIGLTGATGFIGHYIVKQLIESGHTLRCWHRAQSVLERLEPFRDAIEWVPGELSDNESAAALVEGCDAVVHNAFWRPGSGFRGAEGDIVEFTRTNVCGTLNLIEKSMSAGAGRFIFVSTCAVHEKIMDDRPLDEAHPLWPLTHYGAHKAAIEKFVHSYGHGQGYPVCAVRPSGVYGIRYPVSRSKWHPLIAAICAGENVEVSGGGKEVHAADVAKAIDLLLGTDGIQGECYSCCDRYVSEHEVATIAKEISGSSSEIIGLPKTPKHEIVTEKIESLGLQFGSTELLRETIAQLINEIQKSV